jgi:hypothetical protein
MKSDVQIVSELREASAGLLFMSESDYPFEVVLWEGRSEISPEFLRQQTGEAFDATVQTQTVEEFFRVAASEAEWRSAQERVEAKRYQALIRLMKENLSGLKVYRVGQTNIPVYIIGKSLSGNWLGLATRVVET